MWWYALKFEGRFTVFDWKYDEKNDATCQQVASGYTDELLLRKLCLLTCEG